MENKYCPFLCRRGNNPLSFTPLVKNFFMTLNNIQYIFLYVHEINYTSAPSGNFYKEDDHHFIYPPCTAFTTNGTSFNQRHCGTHIFWCWHHHVDVPCQLYQLMCTVSSIWRRTLFLIIDEGIRNFIFSFWLIFFSSLGTAVVHHQAINDQLAVQLSTLYRSNYFGGKCLLFHEPPTVSLKASGSLKCFTTGRSGFRTYVKLVLVDLKQRAQQYQSFYKLYL